MLGDPAATDAEIVAMAARLGLGGHALRPACRKATAGHVHQSLPHGRSHLVAVEIRHSKRPIEEARPHGGTGGQADRQPRP